MDIRRSVMIDYYFICINLMSSSLLNNMTKAMFSLPGGGTLGGEPDDGVEPGSVPGANTTAPTSRAAHDWQHQGGELQQVHIQPGGGIPAVNQRPVIYFRVQDHRNLT